MVDEEDYNAAMAIKWRAQRAASNENNWYVTAKVNGETLYLHRYLMQAGRGETVDHIDGNGLNCTRGNMRLCPHRLNKANTPRNSNNTSGYKGVSYDRAKGKWKASLKVNYKTINIGRFTTPEEAARAYDRVALDCWGEYAMTNERLGLLP